MKFGGHDIATLSLPLSVSTSKYFGDSTVCIFGDRKYAEYARVALSWMHLLMFLRSWKGFHAAPPYPLYRVNKKGCIISTKCDLILVVLFLGGVRIPISVVLFGVFCMGSRDRIKSIGEIGSL